jgi:hypothetical protein
MTDPTTPGYETRDVWLKPIVYTAVGFLVVVVAIQLGMFLLFDLFVAREAARTAADRPLAAELRRASPPEPRLQTAPRDDLLALRSWEDRLLTTYALVDREAGIVRIPVERAMDLLAERGLPVRKSAPEAAGDKSEPSPKGEPKAEAPPKGEPAPKAGASGAREAGR